MKSTKIFLISILMLFGLALSAQQKPTASDQKMKIFIDALMKKMTIDENIGKLNLIGDGDITTGPSANSEIG